MRTGNRVGRAWIIDWSDRPVWPERPVRRSGSDGPERTRPYGSNGYDWAQPARRAQQAILDQRVRRALDRRFVIHSPA